MILPYNIMRIFGACVPFFRPLFSALNFATEYHKFPPKKKKKKLYFQAVPSPPTAGLLWPARAPRGYSRPECQRDSSYFFFISQLQRPQFTLEPAPEPRIFTLELLRSPPFSLYRGTYLLKCGPNPPPPPRPQSSTIQGFVISMITLY